MVVERGDFDFYRHIDLLLRRDLLEAALDAGGKSVAVCPAARAPIRGR